MTYSHIIDISLGVYMRKFIFSLFIIFPVILSAQEKDTYLESLIAEGLLNNLTLRQKSVSVEQSMSALKQARGMFLPSVSIQARYSRAGGGRQIEFPVGDLLNPVYKSLNDLLALAGQAPPPFPILQNERIPFLRKEEHETKLQLAQPIIQPAILFNYQLRQDLAKIEDAGLSLFKRQLINDIQRAYYNYLIATQISELYQKTKSVLEENLRVSQALFEVHKVTKDVIYRAQAEMSALEEEQLKSKNQKNLSRSYLNFLLNRPMTAEINGKHLPEDIPFYLADFETVLNSALKNREEIQQVRLGSSAAGQQINISRSHYFPSLSAVLDYGFQGEKYRFTDRDDYWMASAVLQWNLFNGFQDQAQYEISQLEQKKYQLQEQQLIEQIKLEVRQAYDNCESALQQIEVARDRRQSAKSSFDMVRKKYEQGMASQIEFLDARSQFTNAGINAIIAHYNFFICRAELERISAQRKIELN